MQAIRRILVILDPSTDEQLAEIRATMLAPALGAEIELFECDYNAALEADNFLEEDKLTRARGSYLRDREKLLEERAARLRAEHPGLEVTTDLAWHRPLHEGILEKISESQPDLVITATHYQSRVRRTLFSNTDWHLIRECPVPLMLVKRAEWKEGGGVVAAVDPLHTRDKPAALDQRILDYTIGLATALEVPAWALHCWTQEAMEADDLEDDSLESYDSVHRERLRTLVEDYSIAPERTIATCGRVEDELCDNVADMGANLTVMGAVSRSFLRGWILGNTAEKVLDRIGSDVLVVKPDRE